jgi:hypothetical protein
VRNYDGRKKRVQTRNEWRDHLTGKYTKPHDVEIMLPKNHHDPQGTSKHAYRLTD